MSSLAVVIIADDLTGALDSSAPFAALGMRCIATLAPAHLAAAMAKAPQVLAVNLGSRELPPEHAEGQVTQAVHALRRFVGPDTIWLKKIDSRLKGPVAVETNAVARALGIGRVLLCPAIPELGRVVRQGKVDGAGIVKAIKIDVRLPMDLQISIPDAETDADLDRILRATGPGWLMVGARGLAGAIARSLCKDRLPEPAKLPTGPLGFVIGSRDPITLAQIAALRAAGGPRWIAAPAGQVPHLKAKGSMLVQATPGPGADGKTVSMRLARGALAYLPGLCAVVAGGGETVAALLASAGVGLLHVQGEVLPGLPLCLALDVPDFPALVTKSGGFGTPDTLLRLWQTSTQALDTHPCP